MLENKQSFIQGKKERPRLVLDTITTRFLLLFLFFLFIPLFSLIFYTASLLNSQVEEESRHQLQLSVNLLNGKISQEQSSLQNLGERIVQGLSQGYHLKHFCKNNTEEACFIVDPRQQALVFPDGHQVSWANALKNGAGESLFQPNLARNDRSFLGLWSNHLYLFSQVRLGGSVSGGEGEFKTLLLGKLVDEAFLNSLYKDNPTLETAIWIVKDPDGTSQTNGWIKKARTNDDDASSSMNPEHLLGFLRDAPRESVVNWGHRGYGQYKIVQQPLYNALNQKIARVIHLYSMKEHQTWLNSYYYGIYFTVLISLVLAMILAMIVARSITQPLLKLIQQVDVLSRTGDLSHRMAIKGVHEIHQLCNSFNRMLDLLRGEQQMKDDFVATLTHDLKVPMLAEKQSLEFLDNGTYGPLSDMQQDIIRLMKTSNQSSLGLVNGILEVYRYDSGKVNLVFDQIDLMGVLNETMAELQSLATEKNIELGIENRIAGGETPSPVIVRADRLEIKRVLLNLISNAITNTPRSGRIICEIADQQSMGRDFLVKMTDLQNTSLERPIKLEGHVLLGVRDTGIGFMNEDLPHLFKRFAANRGRNPMSIGLGLYNCYQVIQAHQGILWVETTEGEGAMVSFTLPVNEQIANERRKYGDRRKN